jgi:hypothetical protein
MIKFLNMKEEACSYDKEKDERIDKDKLDNILILFQEHFNEKFIANHKNKEIEIKIELEKTFITGKNLLEIVCVKTYDVLHGKFDVICERKYNGILFLYFILCFIFILDEDKTLILFKNNDARDDYLEIYKILSRFYSREYIQMKFKMNRNEKLSHIESFFYEFNFHVGVEKFKFVRREEKYFEDILPPEMHLDQCVKFFNKI